MGGWRVFGPNSLPIWSGYFDCGRGAPGHRGLRSVWDTPLSFMYKGIPMTVANTRSRRAARSRRDLPAAPLRLKRLARRVLPVDSVRLARFLIGKTLVRVLPAGM